MIDFVQSVTLLVLAIGLLLNAWWDHKDRMDDGARWFHHWQQHYDVDTDPSRAIVHGSTDSGHGVPAPGDSPS